VEAPANASIDLTAVAYGEGRFVAVGSGTAALTSTDGRSWTPENLGSYYTLRDVVFGNSRFVAVGDSGAVLVRQR
jgi:photosystem II stability/assembly factor-like uncharacterized protein